MEAGAEGDDSQPDVGERPAFAGEQGEQPEGFEPAPEQRRDYQQGNRDYQQNSSNPQWRAKAMLTDPDGALPYV